MIDSTNRPESRDAAIFALATHLLHDHDDALHTFELIAPLLDDFTMIELAACCDICPMHLCDIDICADDNELACLEYRN